VKLLGLTLLLGLLFSPLTLAAQSARPVPFGVRQADQAQGKFEKSSIPPQNQRPAIGRSSSMTLTNWLLWRSQFCPRSIRLPRACCPRI